MSIARDIFSCALAINSIADRVDPDVLDFLHIMRNNLHALSIQVAHMEEGLTIQQPSFIALQQENRPVFWKQ